jgi:hypothetical protein
MSMGWDHVSKLQQPTGLLTSAREMSVESHGRLILTGENQRTRKRKTLCRCDFVEQKSHIDWKRREPGPPWWEVGYQLPEQSFFFFYLCERPRRVHSMGLLSADLTAPTLFEAASCFHSKNRMEWRDQRWRWQRSYANKRAVNKRLWYLTFVK